MQQSLSSTSNTATDLPTIKFTIPTLTIIEDFDKLIAKEVTFDETGKLTDFECVFVSHLIFITYLCDVGVFILRRILSIHKIPTLE